MDLTAERQQHQVVPTTLSPDDIAVLKGVYTALHQALGAAGAPNPVALGSLLEELTEAVTPEMLFANRLVLTAWLHGLDFPVPAQRKTLERLTALQRQLALH